MHSGLSGCLDLLPIEADSQPQFLVDSDEEGPEETTGAAEVIETHPTEWDTDEIIVPDDDSNGADVKVARGGPAIRNPRRPARGGKVRAPTRRSYAPWDRRTSVLFEPRDLPSLGDVTTVVHDTVQEDVAYETELRHAPRLLEKIEVERRRAVVKARAMRCASMVDERGRPLAGSSKAKATILDEAPEDADEVDPAETVYAPVFAKLEGGTAEARERERFFEHDHTSGTNGTQAAALPSLPMQVEEVEQLQMLAKLRASRPKRC